jgi:hypothetical protein
MDGDWLKEALRDAYDLGIDTALALIDSQIEHETRFGNASAIQTLEHVRVEIAKARGNSPRNESLFEIARQPG